MEFNSLTEENVFDKGLLRAERARRSWSQQDLADRAGVSVQTVKLLEAERTGDHEPRVDTVKRIADAFGLHWALFFGLKV